MSEWPKTIENAYERPGRPDGSWIDTSTFEVIPADLGRDLYEVLLGIHEDLLQEYGELRTTGAESVLARYEREVGSDATEPQSEVESAD